MKYSKSKTSVNENKASNKAVEVATAILITLGIIAVVILTYKFFNPDCETSKGGVSKINKAVPFKDKYRSENMNITPMKLNPPANYAPDSWQTEGAPFPEKHNRLRLHEFKLGENKEVIFPDMGRSLESPHAAIAGWFRIPADSNERITFFSKKGSQTPRVPGGTLELRPGQRIIQLSSEQEHISLKIYNDEGSLAREISSRVPNLRDGQWHYISMSVGPKYGMSIFLDGLKLVSDRSAPAIPTNIHPTDFTILENSKPMVFASNISYFIQEIDPITMSALYNGGSPTDPTIMTPFVRAWIPLQDDNVVDVLGNIRGTLVNSGIGSEKNEAVVPVLPAGKFYGNLAKDVKFVQKDAVVVPQKTSFVM
jgi:hypothetical protein